MSFQDIFNEGFLESATSISATSIGITLLLAFMIGIFIFQIYKKTYQSVVYTKSFNISLVMMTMVTSLVILAVTSNVVLSLGMVGALSIVRFRSAVKDPMDIVFMFWAIAAGIITGAGFYLLAVVGSFVLGIIIYVLTKNVKQETPYMLLINFSDESAEQQILDKIKVTVAKYLVRSKTVDAGGSELTIELRIKDGETAFINELNRIKSVSNAMLVSSNEYSV
ncbi:DUF4956 domain-containing protein [Vallitalea okinawensis]|uniref:DUF4956 domain-containing protein n=1 Tax=Vallitalea okinawensis TaxID=2078660 RepID=UPI000CFB88E3|nr:DUF4956 domain-containing protein [Vallitalea okinawensis]